jgi:hypothetical protein
MQTIKLPDRPAELLIVKDDYGDALLARELFRSAKIAINSFERANAA